MAKSTPGSFSTSLEYILFTDDGKDCVTHIGFTNFVMAYRTGAKVLA